MSYVPSFPGDVQILYGPPGTGKTTELLDILERVLKKYKPDEIAFVSFTREGARQGIRRACSRFNYTFKDFPYFRTMHSLAFHALELTKDMVMTPAHYRMFGEAIGMRFAGYYSQELHSPDDRYLFLYDLARNNRAYAEEIFLSQDIDMSILDYVVKQLAVFKKTYNVLDYTDMIQRFVQENRSIPAKVVFLDEAQDFTTLQWHMGDGAFRHAKEVYIAGDDDQAIYSWSGADVGAFLALAGNKRVLDTTHRFGENILSFAKTITAQISLRAEKEYVSRADREAGVVEYISSLDDVPLNLTGTYMFLVRNVKFMADIAAYLRAHGYLYSDKKGASIKPAQIAAIRAWEDHRKTKRRLTPTEEIRIKGASGKDAKDLPDLPWREVFADWDDEFKDYISHINDTYPEFDGVEPAFHIATIHTVKGGAADNVILFLSMSKLTHDSFIREPDPEHRAFYVGATRARKRLYLVQGNTPYEYPIFPVEACDGDNTDGV